MVPNDKIVVETDAPYLPPVPYRGKVCEPWMVTVTASFIKDEFGIKKESLINNSKKTAFRAVFFYAIFERR